MNLRETEDYHYVPRKMLSGLCKCLPPAPALHQQFPRLNNNHSWCFFFLELRDATEEGKLCLIAALFRAERRQLPGRLDKNINENWGSSVLPVLLAWLHDFPIFVSFLDATERQWERVSCNCSVINMQTKRKFVPQTACSISVPFAVYGTHCRMRAQLRNKKTTVLQE